MTWIFLLSLFELLLQICFYASGVFTGHVCHTVSPCFRR